MDFRILGPVEVWHEGERLPVGGAKPRALLALLLLELGRVVSADRLIAELWEGAPPPGARNAVQRHVSRLRRVLSTADEPLLEMRSPGYLLRIAPEHVDLHRFRELVGAGRAALGKADPERASALLSEALALWRGPPLADAPASIRDGVVPRLNEAHAAALEDWTEAELALGHHETVVGELRELVDAYPLRERFAGHLMTALYRCERQAEALEVYREARDRFIAMRGVEPGPALRRLHQAILRADESLDLPATATPGQRREPPGSHGGNVPSRARTSFVGRDRELAELPRLLADQPLVTLLGAPGCGKTRLAVEVAGRVAHEYPDGAWVVELDAVAGPELVPATVAAALGVPEDVNRAPIAGLVEDLAGSRLLLVLDNCEHVAAECGRLVDVLLARCPDVRVLATSREPLGTQGESVYIVAPLSVPADVPVLRGGERPGDRTADPEEPATTDAVRLFIDRARRVQPGFQLEGRVAESVARICRSVDGLPLGIELAAARLRVLSVDQVAGRLDRQLGLLASRRSLTSRQRSLRAALDWSYGLLSERERLLFARLSVFAGGFTLEAAEAVCAGGQALPGEVLDVLRDLVDRSLVVGEPAGDQVRFRLLETLRQYGEERLDQTDDAEAVRRQHAEHFCELAERAERERRSAQRSRWLDVLRDEYANLRTALSWSCQSSSHELSLRLVGALWWFWLDQPSEGLRWARLALSAAPTLADRHRQRALFTAGHLASRFPLPEARGYLEESLEVARKRGDDHAVVPILVVLGVIDLERGDFGAARDSLESALATARALDDDYGVARSLVALGMTSYFVDELDVAEPCFREARDIFRRLGDDYGTAEAVQCLGQVAYFQGDLGRARRLLEQVTPTLARLNRSDGARARLFLARIHQDEGRWAPAGPLLRDAVRAYAELREYPDLGVTLDHVAGQALGLGQAERAGRLLGAADALRSTHDLRLLAPERLAHDRLHQQVRSALGEQGYAGALGAGARMGIDAAVAEALRDDPGILSGRSAEGDGRAR